MHTLLWVGLGGCIGSMGRYLVTIWMSHSVSSHYPWGTTLVNVVGCFLIGLLITCSAQRFSLTPELRGFLISGMLGGLTTFSTFGYEVVHAFLNGHADLGITIMARNLMGGLFAVWLGIKAAQL